MTRSRRTSVPELNWLDNVHRNEDGMVTWAFLVAILFLLCFSGLVYNAGNTVNRKLAVQNAADAVSYSSSLWVARGMNAMTASNHLIGELNAMYVIHHSLAGKWADDSSRNYQSENSNHRALKSANGYMKVVFEALNNSGPPIPALDLHHDEIAKDPAADRNSMLFEAKLQLKRIMAGTYTGHAAGYGVYLAPFPGAQLAGMAIMAAAFAVEWKVYQEYLVLEGIEIVAHSTKMFKKQIPMVIDTLVHNGYQKLMLVANVPRLAVNSADSVAAKHGMQGAAYGDTFDKVPSDMLGLLQQAARVFPLLPVEQETTTDERRSQLMRSTYPWVAYWRTSINKFLRWTCTFSGAASKYTRWTNNYSLQTCTWLRRETSQAPYRKELTIENFGHGGSGNGEKGKEVRLFVVTGLNDTPNGVGKSQELWNNWNRRSDATSEIEKQFCHVGFAYTNNPPVIAAGKFYRQENPDGIVCFAQSMVYNANPQQKPKGPGPLGGNQPSVGWDTLNWTSNAKEFPSSMTKEIKLSSPPRIKLNWQAKLTPVTPQKFVRVTLQALANEKTRNVLTTAREGLVLTNH